MGDVEPVALEAMERDVLALRSMTLRQLKDFWQERWGDPPEVTSAEFLRRWVAWRLQAPLLGGVSPQLRQRLKAPEPPQYLHFEIGTKFAREYRGKLYEVEVTERGFRRGDRTYRSLSHVAREITGTHWNGASFFGLRPNAW